MKIFERPHLADPRAPLYWNAISMLVCLFVLIPLIIFDERLVTGSAVWIKPLKFTLSIGIYSLTFIWILQFFPKTESIYLKISWILTITSWIEILAIFGQAARGEQSHFNITTPLNGLIFSLMGISIGIFWLAHLTLSFFLLKQRDLSPFLKEGLLWGLLISAYGMIIGFFMTTPRPEQIEMMKQGILKVIGGHTFGAEDGGAGIRFFGWSTVAGDMRVAHFFGMHAIQFFTILIMMVLGFDAKKSDRYLSNTPLRFLGTGILGITITMTIQSLFEESIFHTSAKFGYIYIAFLFVFMTGCILLTKNMKFILIKEGK